MEKIIEFNINELFNKLKKNYVVVKSNDNEFMHLFGPVDFPIITKNGERIVFDWYVWYFNKEPMDFSQLLEYLKERGSEKNYNSIFTYGDFSGGENPLVRVHSCCLTGDIFSSSRCDCGLQLEKSIELIKKNNCGAVVYMSNHEGRGIGLYAKAIANKIQEYGYDTYEANNLLNFDDDERNFEEAVEVLKYFREGKEIDLLSNNPEKINHIKGGGIKINNIHPLVGFENSDNYKYLRSKMLHAKKVI